jgi:hypothetical protein
LILGSLRWRREEEKESEAKVVSGHTGVMDNKMLIVIFCLPPFTPPTATENPLTVDKAIDNRRKKDRRDLFILLLY